ncbi:KxYKxGKxW signal peptide domain-containing protein, partial [Streptococcus urinalis]
MKLTETLKIVKLKIIKSLEYLMIKKKMYKSKKHWVIASVATVAILGTHQATILADSSDTTMINPT